MNDEPLKSFIADLKEGQGLRDEFIYYMTFEDYVSFPDPFPRTFFTAREVQERIRRYSNPQKPGELFSWDIHGTLLTPTRASIPGVAVVMIHGGAANEYEFLFTPDGPEQFIDLTKIPPETSRAGIAQHIASLGMTVLAISLPGHFSRRPWPPIAARRPEFIIGEVPDDEELKNRLAVYTFRLCLEAIKALIERHLPDYKLYIWGHSTGGEYFYLMEQSGLNNPLLGGLGFGTGMPAGMRKEWDLAANEKPPEESAKKFRPITDLSRRSPESYVKSGYVGPNQPWGSVERWFELENHRRPQFKPFLQDIEHSAHDVLLDEVKKRSGLPDEELFIGFRADLTRLKRNTLLYFVGELDKGHWIDGAKKGLEFRREVFAFRRFAPHADQVRLVVIPKLTHYGHIEAHNERLANLMVTGFKEYFSA
ncbi:MAG: alpha/beta fold hydrolase [Deltaproteobacteria bacterium]|nr:alpha/beta fold hydrolase [Deltaproteobacteria bacterium]